MSSRLLRYLHVSRELGWKQVFQYAVYQLGLKTGYWKLRTPIKTKSHSTRFEIKPLFPPPPAEQLCAMMGTDGYASLLKEAEAIVDEEKYALFGGPPASIQLVPPEQAALRHWSEYEAHHSLLNNEDIKFTWEPARLGWVFPLLRAYHLTGAARYREKFWQLIKRFLAHNPPMQGPNWMSAQEAAIRLCVLALWGWIFLKDDPEQNCHQSLLVEAINHHARRIPPTMLYARAQNNNHLITEALGLYATGSVLPDHPAAPNWRRLGLKYLNLAFETQINAVGEYAQHSNNYHRLMLQCAVIAQRLAHHNHESLSTTALQNLRAASLWLCAEIDGISGLTANYGHNDGAYLFPFTNTGFNDYRPVAQAAYALFMEEKPAFPVGAWDEFAVWLGIDLQSHPPKPQWCKPEMILKLGTTANWARMRANFYTSRPGHADQLHVDLWYNGTPVTLDPGTFLYNGAAPWDNQLMSASLHNTITIDGKDQMFRAGRFLWSEWAQACSMRPEACYNYVQAEHNGYRSLGIMHRRKLEQLTSTVWQVEDVVYTPKSLLLSGSPQTHQIRIHWLLPDTRYTLHDEVLQLVLPSNTLAQLEIETTPGMIPDPVQVVRAGFVLSGGGECMPQTGWYSPTYGVKEPALSFSLIYTAQLPFTIISRWTFSG